MSLTLTEYRCKLINKILFARSEDEVNRFVEAGIRGLRAHKINGHLIARFVEKATQDLDNFHSANKDAQQWANIRTARIQFKRSIQTMVENEKRIL